METFDISQFDPMANGPAGVSIKFYNRLEEDTIRSKDEGRPMYRESVWIEKAILGTNDIIDRPAFEADFKEHAAQYARFKRQTTDHPELEGTPLSEFPGMGRTRIAELNALNIFTLEQFVSLNDSAISRCGAGTRKEIERAKAWMASAKSSSAAPAMAADLLELKAQLEAAREEIEELRKNLKDKRRKKDDGGDE